MAAASATPPAAARRRPCEFAATGFPTILARRSATGRDPMSAFKDLLVTIDASREGRQRLAVAVELAQRSGAHLTGCYRALALEPTAASDLTETGRAGPPEVSHEGTLAETMEQRFRDDLARFDLQGDWLGTGERALDDVVGRTRTADLAIVGLGDPDRLDDNPQGFR